MASDAIDDDVERAVVALWQQQAVLAELFPRGPITGRLKSPAPLPYVQLSSTAEPARTQRYTGNVRKDVRKLTLTLYGLRAQVVQGLAQVLGVFNDQMGAPNRPSLVFPSGARFIKWWPTNDGVIEEDPDTKEGQDIWRAVVQAEVYSVRRSTGV